MRQRVIDYALKWFAITSPFWLLAALCWYAIIACRFGEWDYAMIAEWMH